MVNLEARNEYSPEATKEAPVDKPELILRGRILAAIEKKIEDHSFYPGYNRVMLGLATPIRKSRGISLDPQFSSGDTLEDFYYERESEKKEGESTPESLFSELRVEAQERLDPADSRTADEMFGGSLVVRQDSKSRLVNRGDRKKKRWAGLKTWERDWEIVGKSLGGVNTPEEIAAEYGLTRKRIEEIIGSTVSDALAHEGAINYRPRGKREEKLSGLLILKESLIDPESELSRIILDIQNGLELRELNIKYGRGKAVNLKKRLLKLLGEKVFP